MKAINVYGTGVHAINFLLNNPDVKVQYLIEGKKDIKACGSIPVIKTEHANKELHLRYTVVACSDTVYCEIKNMLEQEFRLVEFVDFEYWETYGKELAMIYGNCHTRPMKEMLNSSKEFSLRYGFYPIPPVQTIVDANKPLMDSIAFSKCVLFLHQCVQMGNRYGDEYASGRFLKKLPAHCNVIGFPNLYRMPRFLYPQIDYDKEIFYGELSTYHISDKYIDRYHIEKSMQDLYHMIEDEYFISHQVILDGMDQFYHKLSVREQEWDIRVSDFIRNNLKSKQLFYDPYHPSNHLISYIVKEILHLLDMEFNQSTYVWPLDHDEIPVYKSVSKALKLEYSIDYMRQYSRNTLNSLPLDLYEYIKQYIAWVHRG